MIIGVPSRVKENETTIEMASSRMYFPPSLGRGEIEVFVEASDGARTGKSRDSENFVWPQLDSSLKVVVGPSFIAPVPPPSLSRARMSACSHHGKRHLSTSNERIDMLPYSNPFPRTTRSAPCRCGVAVCAPCFLDHLTEGPEGLKSR